jgi:NADH dehydrogenase
MQALRTIAIIGGGFAGTTLARVLDGKLPRGYELLLISEESHTTFTPMLPEAVGAAVFPEQIVAPIRQMLRKSRFVMGRVTDIDFSARTIACETLAGARTFAYAHVVLALGNRARLDLIPGVAEHALPLKTIGDAMHLRNVVLRRLARIELEPDAALREHLGHFVVIGGGFSGVETAGALADSLRDIAAYYPRVARSEVKVTLLQDIERLLPELSERLGHAAHRSLAERGVDVKVNARVARVSERGALLADGTMIEASSVVCTIGTMPNPLVKQLAVPLERGRVVVDDDLRVKGIEAAWAVGDCAWIRNAQDGLIAPPTAQFAIREARCLAHNVLATERGKPTRPFRYRPRGSMAAIGHRRGVAEVFGIPLWGFAAWLLWRAYYLSQMPTLGRKLRIFVEWSWAMLFRTDITHLRFHRSVDLEDAQAVSTESSTSSQAPACRVPIVMEGSRPATAERRDRAESSRPAVIVDS